LARLPIYHSTFEEGLRSALRKICEAVKSDLDNLDKISPPGDREAVDHRCPALQRCRRIHASGKTDIQSSAQAAEALKPAAGAFAEFIFALGIVGTGLLAVPVLAGSTAYAIGEGRRWPVGLSRKPRETAAFYSVMALSVALGGNHQLHRHRSNQGAILECGYQRRIGGARHDDHDVVGPAAICNG
jgi:hypothetical protein